MIREINSCKCQSIFVLFAKLGLLSGVGSVFTFPFHTVHTFPQTTRNFGATVLSLTWWGKIFSCFNFFPDWHFLPGSDLLLVFYLFVGFFFPLLEINEYLKDCSKQFSNPYTSLNIPVKDWVSLLNMSNTGKGLSCASDTLNVLWPSNVCGEFYIENTVNIILEFSGTGSCLDPCTGISSTAWGSKMKTRHKVNLTCPYRMGSL